jgi:hypothetical protein
MTASRLAFEIELRTLVFFLLTGSLLVGAFMSLTFGPQEAIGAIDSVAPTVSIAKPSQGITVGSTIMVTGVAADNLGGSGISSVELKVNSGNYVKATPKSLGDWSTWSHSLTFNSNDWKAIVAKATDKAGNEAWFKVSVFSDISPPSITVSSPKASSSVPVGTLSVTGIAADNTGGSGIKQVDVRVGTGIYALATPKAPGDWSTWSMPIKLSTAGGQKITARATDKAGNLKWFEVPITVTATSTSPTLLDKFGIKKIYQTKSGGNEWFVNMDDPTSDPLFRNLPSMTKQTDGSWQVSGGTKGQVRMEAWSPPDKKWLNVEITGYAKMVSGTNELIQWYSRGGHHTSTNECLGSAYKARLYGDGDAAWVKEVTHPAYAGNRGSMQATTTALADRWVGFKAVIYNFVENGKTHVRMESYIDDAVTDSAGKLVIKNNWKLASVVEDKGGWSTSDADFNSTCAPLNKDSTQQYRQRADIINTGGGTSTQNIAAWRSDDLTWNWKYLSAREIVPPS